MELWLDTADCDEIREGYSWGVVSGVTTNPSLCAKQNLSFREMVKTVCAIVDPSPVSAEAISMKRDEIVAEARELSKIAPNVVVKIPCMLEGLAATKEVAAEGIRVNMTLAFTPNQALLAAAAGASFVSPFLGRLDDIGEDGIAALTDICEIYERFDIATKVVSASIRHPLHVTQSALAGADIATIPFKVFKMMVKHPLTDRGIETFLADWEKVSK